MVFLRDSFTEVAHIYSVAQPEVYSEGVFGKQCHYLARSSKSVVEVLSGILETK